jgi:hypothetical protein
MKNTTLWASTSLFNFCIVGLLGVILRSKILFDLPWINYLNLLDAHSHFAFGGWITLSLLMLFVRELLPELYRNKNVYQWMLGSIFLSSAGTLLPPFWAWNLKRFLLWALYSHLVRLQLGIYKTYSWSRGNQDCLPAKCLCNCLFDTVFSWTHFTQLPACTAISSISLLS